MWPGPVFQVELLTLSRRARYYGLRSLYGLLILLFIALQFPDDVLEFSPSKMKALSIGEMSARGREIFAIFAWVQSITLVVLTPGLVAGVIADERQRKTLDYLLSSTLTSPEIVLGKLFARLLVLGLLLAIGLPIMLLILLFGGIDPFDILLFFGCSTLCTIFVGSFSIAVSCQAKRPRDAITMAYALEFCWLLGLPFVNAVFEPTSSSPPVFETIHNVVAFLCGSSPVDVIARSIFRPTSEILWRLLLMAAQLSVYSAFFIVAAIVKVRPSRKKRTSPSKAWRWFETKRSWRVFRRPECFDDAMLWKELICSGTSLSYQLIYSAFFAAYVSLIIYIGWEVAVKAIFESGGSWAGWNQDASRQARDNYGEFLKLVLSFSYVFIALKVVTSAATAFSSEREEDTWISLIATPLTAFEIIRAKALRCLLGLKWIAGFLGSIIGLGVLIGSVHPIGVVLSAAVTAVHLAFACVLGLYCSIRCRNSTRAICTSLGILMALNFLVFVLLMVISIWGNERSYVNFLFPFFTPTAEYFALIVSRDLSYMFQVGEQGGELIELACGLVLSQTLYLTMISFLSYLIVFRFDEWNDRPKTVR